MILRSSISGVGSELLSLGRDTPFGAEDFVRMSPFLPTLSILPTLAPLTLTSHAPPPRSFPALIPHALTCLSAVPCAPCMRARTCTRTRSLRTRALSQMEIDCVAVPPQAPSLLKQMQASP